MQSWPYQIAGIEALDQYSAEKNGSGRLAKEIAWGACFVPLGASELGYWLGGTPVTAGSATKSKYCSISEVCTAVRRVADSATVSLSDDI
jgi:hypothetical protein